MVQRRTRRLLTLSDRVYRALHLLYPAAHRREYGPLMTQLFRDMCREALATGGALGLAKLWLHTMPDIATTAMREYLAEEATYPMTDIPAKIDRYEVKELVAIATAGEIYRAHDPETGREVVVKTARPPTATSEEAETTVTEGDIRESMKREAELLTQLDHPTIPKCYAYLEEENRVCVVMDFVKGTDLLSMLEAQAANLPEADVIDWAVQVCDFLIYMHSQQPEPLIFRDMKPANIMVDSDGRVHILDFGIAEQAAGVGLKRIGTIGYSPPEQYAGKSDVRSDIFAFGVTLYHLLTGRDPRKDHAAFLFHVFPPRSLNPTLSEAMETVILKATEHKAEDRYQSAEALKAALLACA